MSPSPYRIDQSRHVTEQFRKCAEEARSRGLGAEFLEASQRMSADLKSKPLDIGEARENYPYISIRCRIAFFPPLSVIYGVNESERLVIIVKVQVRFPKSR